MEDLLQSTRNKVELLENEISDKEEIRKEFSLKKEQLEIQLEYL